MSLDALELMKCIRGDIALTTIGAADDGDVLDHQQIGTLPIASSDVTDFGTARRTDRTRETRTSCYSSYTVMIGSDGTRRSSPAAQFRPRMSSICLAFGVAESETNMRTCLI